MNVFAIILVFVLGGCTGTFVNEDKLDQYVAQGIRAEKDRIRIIDRLTSLGSSVSAFADHELKAADAMDRLNDRLEREQRLGCAALLPTPTPIPSPGWPKMPTVPPVEAVH